MAVKYNVVARRKPGDPNSPEKFYPSVKSSGRVTVRQLAEEVARISTLSPVDVMAAIEAFLMVVPSELSRGNIVDLGDFGSFRLRIQTEAAETADAVTSHQIKKVLPRFTPAKTFQQSLDKTTFEKDNK